MVKAIVVDFSRVLMFAKRQDVKSLSAHHRGLSESAQEYNVLDHFDLNEELLAYLNTLKEFFPIYIFSNGTLHEPPEVRIRLMHIFTKIHTAAELGIDKDSPQSYVKLAEHLGFEPDEILFIDDTPANVEAAASAGLRTVHFVSNIQALAEMEGEISRT